MASSSPLLTIDQRIIELEAEVSATHFSKRWALAWIGLGNPLLIGAIVAGNMLIDFSKPGSGRPALNTLGTIVTIISILLSVAFWNVNRSFERAKTVELLQAQAERRSLEVATETEAATSQPFQEYYRSIPDLRDEYRKSAERYRSRHNLFQLTVIVGSILTSVSTTAAAEQGIWSWIAVGLSALVSISAGVIAYFKFRERSLNLQQTADSIDQEVQAYSLRIRRYRNLAPDEASSAFAEELERIREEQRKKELQLEQPPEAVSQQRPHSL
ncbi:DUF4231 domain-containing protein [Streptomyces sp. NBC_00250]|uniref:DUF4231 domain-containing protein n=1 Tax=Streptomyces sp. NBC_00250 TaxID=2903641 RepID=UPI002E283146|nr:DUF4231 domain-containing protein [Streptomyces sp. NBC_00250]